MIKVPLPCSIFSSGWLFLLLQWAPLDTPRACGMFGVPRNLEYLCPCHLPLYLSQKSDLTSRIPLISHISHSQTSGKSCGMVFPPSQCWYFQGKQPRAVPQTPTGINQGLKMRNNKKKKLNQAWDSPASFLNSILMMHGMDTAAGMLLSDPWSFPAGFGGALIKR